MVQTDTTRNTSVSHACWGTSGAASITIQRQASPFAEEAAGLRGPADDELGAARLLSGGLLVPRGAARARREEGGLELVLPPLLEPAAEGKSEVVLK